MQLDEGPRDPLDDVQLETTGSEDGRRGSYWPILWVVLLLIAAAAGVYFGLVRRGADREEAPPAPQAAETPSAAESEATPGRPIELPELGASDALVRELVEQLAEHPELATWLAHDELIRRFAVAVDNVAEGKSPRRHLAFLDPDEDFAGEAHGDLVVVDPESYDRYDSVARLLTALDASSVARLYRTLEPLIDEAYRDLGYPDRDFDATLREAIDLLLATPVPEGEVVLVRGVSSYEFADPALEALAPAQKHLLRMGPDNARRIQHKLREIEATLGLE